jgi:hypothetical protein
MSNTGLVSRIDAEFARFHGDADYRESELRCQAIREANHEWQQTHMIDADGTAQHFRHLQKAMLTARNAENKELSERVAEQPGQYGLSFCSGRQTVMQEHEVERRKGEYIPSRREEAREFEATGGIFPGAQDTVHDPVTGKVVPRVKDNRIPFGRSSYLLNREDASKEASLHQGNRPSKMYPLNDLQAPPAVVPGSKYRPSPVELEGDYGIDKRDVEVELEAPQRLTRKEQIAKQRKEIESINALKGGQGAPRGQEGPNGTVTFWID